MPFVELPTGAGIDYLDTATDKPAIVVLHGFLGTGDTQFPQLIAWLSAHFRVIAPTLRGYGNSMPKPRTFPHDFYRRDAEDMLAFLDALHIEKTHLMGYSDGGEVALLMGGLSPERFTSIAVWGAVGYYSPHVRPHAQRMFPATWMTDEDKARHNIPHADAFVLGWIKAVHAIIDSGGDISRSLAQHITAPLLIMLGEEDFLNPPQDAQSTLQHVSNGRLAMFPCGHAIHDQAWADFQRVVGEFLII